MVRSLGGAWAALERTLWRAVWLAMLAGVMALALAPSDNTHPDWFENADKVRHAAAFAAFWWVGVRAFPSQAGRRPWALVAVLLAYGASIEVAQALFTTTREASVADWLADATGLGVGAWAQWVTLACLRWRPFGPRS